MEPTALWADAKLGFDLGALHREAWVRSAVVTDIHRVARATTCCVESSPARCRFSARQVGVGKVVDRGAGPKLATLAR